MFIYLLMKTAKFTSLIARIDQFSPNLSPTESQNSMVPDWLQLVFNFSMQQCATVFLKQGASL